MGGAVADVSQAKDATEPGQETVAGAAGVPSLNRADAEPDTGPHLEDFLPRLNWDTFEGALLFGVQRGWTCGALYSYAIALHQ